MNLLYVHCEEILVGSISYDSFEKKYEFTYEENWVKDGFEISPSLGFAGFDSSAVKNFIENLLPEGEGLEELSIYYQVSKGEKFAILKELGLETTGALTFSSDKIFTQETFFKEITEEALEEKVKMRNKEPIYIWDGTPRLSVAGVQAKLPLLIHNGKMGFGEGALCSTHILKFNRVGENVVTNEFISMKLAKALGFNVAKVDCIEIANECVLFVERFDREIVDENLIKRKHIVDSVQALDLPLSYKYERNIGKNTPNYREGVSFSKLFSLADKAVVPLLFKEQIIKWSILNLIIGNSDAHGKNISFFVSREGLEVAPFYDLVNVTMYDGQYEQDMAMGIDDAFSFDEIDEFSLREFFETNSISVAMYFEEYKKTTVKLERVFKNSDFLENEELAKGMQDYLLKYIENIKNRVNKISYILNSARYPMPLDDEKYLEFFKEKESDIKRSLGKKYVESDNVDEIIAKYIRKTKERFIKELK